MTHHTLHLGDCLEVMRTMPDCSVDAVVTDPPYALPGGFMGKQWDNHDGREDTGFGYWLAGFTDGEGCFRVQRHERGTHTCAFQIKLRRDDRAVLERIRRYVGHGSVRDLAGEGNSKDQAFYVVQDQEGCEVLVGLFKRFPLTAKKALDFEVWADAVGEWVNRPRGNRWHGAADQSQAAVLKTRLENVRAYVEVPWSGHRFQDWCRLWAAECLRVLKPGGYLLAFGAPRQYHRLACGIEDAGFEVRDCCGWVFGSGFPKSKNLEGEWSGWGTALKPAWESIVIARKPFKGTVAANVLEHGTGALNVDGCRVGTTVETWPASRARPAEGHPNALYTHRLAGQSETQTVSTGDAPAGRWPANLIHSGCDEVVGLFSETAAKRGQNSEGTSIYGSAVKTYGATTPNDSGSAARFFYCPKVSKRERGEGNNHPTVKPIALMAYLCRLVTPPDGIILDPFMGSGSTGIAALQEGFDFIGIEREAEYVEIAKSRIEKALGQG